MANKELQNPTHSNPLKNHSRQSESQSSNPEQTLNPQPTPVRTPAQQVSQFNVFGSHPWTSQPLDLTPASSERLLQSCILTGNGRKNLGLKTIEYPSLLSQRKLQPQNTIRWIFINWHGKPIRQISYYQLSNVFQGITNPTDFNFEDCVLASGGQPPSPPYSPPETPKGPLGKELEEETPGSPCLYGWGQCKPIN